MSNSRGIGNQKKRYFGRDITNIENQFTNQHNFHVKRTLKVPLQQRYNSQISIGNKSKLNGSVENLAQSYCTNNSSCANSRQFESYSRVKFEKKNPFESQNAYFVRKETKCEPLKIDRKMNIQKFRRAGNFISRTKSRDLSSGARYYSSDRNYIPNLEKMISQENLNFQGLKFNQEESSQSSLKLFQKKNELEQYNLPSTDPGFCFASVANLPISNIWSFIISKKVFSSLSQGH